MAQLKDLIVTGTSRLINGLQVNGGLVADILSATTANMNILSSTTATISSLQFNNTILYDEGNFLVIKNSTSKILALRTNGTTSFVLRPADVENIKNNIDLGTSSIRWKDLYLSGTGFFNGLTITNSSSADSSIIAQFNDYNGKRAVFLRQSKLGNTTATGKIDLLIGSPNDNNFGNEIGQIFLYGGNSDKGHMIVPSSVTANKNHYLPNGSGWLVSTSTTSSAVGSSTQPVYVDTNGIVTAITGALENNITGSAATLTTGRTLKVNLASNSASTAFNGSANISDIGVSGTLSVANGGTGAASFTANSIIMSGNNTTAAFTSRAVTNNTTNTAIVTGTNIPTMNTIYYGLVKVNGSDQTRATTIYAPTTVGTNGQILTSNGSGAPSWSNKPSYSLSEITSASDVQAIEALTGTSGFLKKTAANTWSLDTATYSTTDENVKQTATSNGNYNLRLLLSSNANDNTLTAGTYKSTNLYYNDYAKTLFVPKIKLNDNSLPLDYENTKILDVPLVRVDSVEGTSDIGTRSYTITTKDNVGLGYAYFRIGSLYTYYSVAGDTTSSVTGTNQYSTQFTWRQYSISTATGSVGLKTAYYESFSLPATNFSRTANGSYNILTTKSTISVAQGGTGIKTASYKNAVVIGNSTTVNSALQTVRTGAGGFYATATDAKPLFGILPLSVGGTGYNNYERNTGNVVYRGIGVSTDLPNELIPGSIVLIYSEVTEI